jgi:hypothetical protein
MAENNEELTEKENLESGSEETENENEPKALWEERGFPSLEAFVASLEGTVASERAGRQVAEQALTVKPAVVAPQFNREAYDADPEGYSTKFNNEVQSYLTSSNTPQYPKAVLDAAVENILLEGEKREINRHVLYGTISSLMIADPTKKAMAGTPDGLRELGRLALEQFTPVKEKEDPETPASHVTPKGSPSGTPVKKGGKKDDEVDTLNKKIAEAGEAGKVQDVVGLILERNAAKLKKEKSGKRS